MRKIGTRDPVRIYETTYLVAVTASYARESGTSPIEPADVRLEPFPATRFRPTRASFRRFHARMFANRRRKGVIRCYLNS